MTEKQNFKRRINNPQYLESVRRHLFRQYEKYCVTTDDNVSSFTKFSNLDWNIFSSSPMAILGKKVEIH